MPVLILGCYGLGVSANQLTLGDDEPFRGRQHLVAIRTRRNVKHLVQREDLEMIVMLLVTDRRPWTEIANNAAACSPLEHARRLGQARLFLNAFGQFCNIRRDVPGDPMNEGRDRLCVRVFSDDGIIGAAWAV